jgi:signal transduction histidine kinase
MAHRVSLVAMHSGALAYRQDLTREETAQAASIIQENAHLALAELRDVLGVLRDTPTAPNGSTVSGFPSPERPQPTLADLDELIAQAQENGMKVVLTRHIDDLCAVPQGLGRHAYRIIQESLTNARKHAPGSPVAIVVGGSPGQRIELEIRNPMTRHEHSPDGPGDPAIDGTAVPGAGMGLLGLGERATLCGGELTHGPTSRGDFVIQAWLPWPA